MGDSSVINLPTEVSILCSRQLLQSQSSSDAFLCLHIPTTKKAKLQLAKCTNTFQKHRGAPTHVHTLQMSPQSQAENLTVPACDRCPATPKLHTHGQFQFKRTTDRLTLLLACVYLDTSPPRGATSLHKTSFCLHSFHQWIQTQKPVLPGWPGDDSPISWRNLTKHLTAKATWQFFSETPWMLPVPEQTHYRDPYLMLHIVSLYNRNAVFSTCFVVHFFLILM